MIYVLYHGPNCPDGFWAAYVAYTHFHNEATYIPVSYNQPLPDIEDGSTVFILDFSYPRNILIDLMNRTNCIVLDHHKTAQEELKNLPNCVFDLNKSGAVLAYEYFYPNSEVREILRYVQDRDLWQWQLKNSREINAYLHIVPKTFEEAGRIYNKPLHDFVIMGKVVLQTHQVMIDSLLNQSFEHNIGGWQVPVVNSSVLQSELGEALHLRYPDAPFVGIFRLLNMNTVNWSLRSEGNFDCGSLAKEYGGGGHPGAAGFIEKLQWNK